MGVLFIIVGIALIGYYFVSQNDQPSPVPAKLGFAAGGVIAIGLAVYLLYLIFYKSSGAEALFFFILSIGSLYAGVKLFQLSAKADSQHATNISDRTRAKDNEAAFEAAKFKKENAIKAAEESASLESDKKKTDAALLRNKRIETNVRNTLAETAEQNGVDVNGIIEINTKKHFSDIELERRAKEREIDFIFKAKETELELIADKAAAHNQLEAADRVEHYSIVDNLDEKLKNLFKERRDVELNEKDEWLKEKNLARLDRRIAQTEADIDGRQNRLLSSSDGKEIKRLT